MKDCIFCKIVKGELPCYKIYENENFVAFLDVFPFCKGHTLVIPKKHYQWVWEVEKGGKYFEICQKIAKHFQIVSRNNLVTSIILGEEVPHAHIHLLPNLDGKVLRKTVNIALLKREKVDDSEAKELVKKLRLR